MNQKWRSIQGVRRHEPKGHLSRASGDSAEHARCSTPEEESLEAPKCLRALGRTGECSTPERMPVDSQLWKTDLVTSDGWHLDREILWAVDRCWDLTSEWQ